MGDTRPELTAEEKDSAKRLMDAVNLHYQARIAAAGQGAPPQFIAARLSDGGSDGELYDTRRDAVRMTEHRAQVHFFVKVGIEMMPFREAVIVLMHHRQAYKNGVRFGVEEPITPQLTELLHPAMPRTLAALDGARERYNRR